jgi:hypothetical protein
MKKVIAISLALLFIASVHSTTSACQRIGKVSLPQLVKSATLIVRASAVRYDQTPNGLYWTTGVPDSTIMFHVEEVLKGKDVPDKLFLNGYLSDKDDFNELPVPYHFVRPGGRGGSCFANTYKQGAQFLLFLKEKPEGTGYTPNFDALAPVNEQLRSADDPWIAWVKDYLRSLEEKPESTVPEGAANAFKRFFGFLSSSI